jgi:hypothetical protein
MRETVLLCAACSIWKGCLSWRFHHVDGIDWMWFTGGEPGCTDHDWRYQSNDGLTGEITDGVVLNYCVPPEYNDRAMELLDKGARKERTQPGAIDKPQQLSALS